ncbi:MAG: BtrH N-terminal domain-containing protein [Actinobacteria bacterium]|nr:BtrH N-terminal domain-containing protein [Actinomycetota bacterium]
MAKVIIEGFVHRPGGHCGSSAMRDVLNFHGLDLTEDMVFGLGAGIGFMYYDNPSWVPPIFIGGRQWGMEKSLCKNLGIGLEVVTGLDSEEAWSAVKELVSDNKPTVVHVDVVYLDYLKAKRHFSQHRILVVGYDEEAGIAYVSDNDRDEIQELPLASLARARSYNGPPIPAGNAFYRLTIPVRFPSIETVIPGAVRDAVRENMLVPPEKASFDHRGAQISIGLAGLERFAAGIGKWTTVMDDETIGLVCKNIYVSAEKGGTGYGGNFRRMYGRFLVESAGVLGPEVLGKIGRELISIGDRWSELSLACKEKSGAGAGVVKEIDPIIQEIYEREKQAFEELNKAADSLS